MEEKEVNNEEAHYGSKIKVVTQNGQAAHLYDAQGNLQTATKANEVGGQAVLGRQVLTTTPFIVWAVKMNGF